MSFSQHSLSLSVAPLFTDATLSPTLSRSPTLNHLNNSFKFENTKETTDENTTAHCSVPMLKHAQAMRRAHLLDGAVSS